MKSHYSDAPIDTLPQRRTLSVLVDNEPGVLARIAGLFSGRGYNIESLTVAEVFEGERLARLLEGFEPNERELAGGHTVIKVAIIPHTFAHTGFQDLRVASAVNVEVDQIVKMVERLTHAA